jgi:hypothetical protein
MQRKIIILLWCAVPLLAIAWHYGPGQTALARDHAASHLNSARAFAAQEDYEQSLQNFAATLADLPAEDPARAPIELEQAVVTAASGDLLLGIEQMSDLLKRLADQGQGNETLARATRSELGEAHYHAAWLMRLEGASTDEWTAEADAARQHFRLLTETASDASDEEMSAKNLESVIRLQRLDLNELMGLPLPKKCSGNCQNLSQKKRQQRESRNDKPKSGDKDKPQDIRKEIQKERDAGKGQRGEGGS